MKFKLLGAKRPSLLRPNDELEVFKHFRVIRKIGSGNYSTVYEVQRLADSEHYALKHIDIRTVDPSEYPDLVNELRLLASLDHPTLTTYFEGFVDAGGQLMVVTDLASEGDLGSLLEKLKRRRGWLPERQVWAHFLQLAVGLQYLHKNRIIHRDLKPQNVLVTGNGLLKIADLGISQMLDTVFARALLGTPHYCSPEMWRRQPYSFSADIWALGCILHEMCTLTPLFLPPGRPTDADIRARVLGGLSEPIPSRYSIALWELIRRMLAPNPADRPTIDEILAMQSVRAHMYLLPNEVLPYLDPSHEGRATLPELFRISATAEKWGLLNEVLPASKYRSGPGVAEALRGTLRRPKSCPDLASLGSGGGGEAEEAGGGALGAGAAARPPSLFRFSAAYPVLKGIMAGEALRRASMGQAQLGWAARAGQAQAQGAVGAGEPLQGGLPRLRRTKSLSDVMRARPAQPVVSQWPWGGQQHTYLPGLSTQGQAGPGISGGGGGFSSLSSGSFGGGGVGSSPPPRAGGWAGGGWLPPGSLSVIEQEPSEYNSSYHGNNSYFGGSYEGSYHGGGAASFDNSYHGARSIFDSSYHGGGKLADGSCRGHKPLFEGSYPGTSRSALESSVRGGVPRFDSSYTGGSSHGSSYNNSGRRFSPALVAMAAAAAAGSKVEKTKPGPPPQEKKKGGLLKKIKKVLYGDSVAERAWPAHGAERSYLW